MPFDFSALVVPTPVVDVISNVITAKSPFIGTGVAVVEPADGTGMGGHNYARRYPAEDAEHNTRITGDALTPGIVGAYRDIGPVLRRARFRRIVDGAGEAEGGLLAMNPTARVIDQTAAYWTAEFDLAFMSILEAAFASTGPLYATHLKPYAVLTGAKVHLSFTLATEAAAVLGDRAGDLIVAVVHSAVAKSLFLAMGDRALAIPIGPTPIAPAGIYLGNLRVIVSDRCPVGGTEEYPAYTSYLLGPGALWTTTQAGMKEFVQTNASVPSIDLTQTSHIACGVSGLSSKSSMGENPTNESLATAANWELSISPATAASLKAITVVAVTTNA